MNKKDNMQSEEFLEFPKQDTFNHEDLSKYDEENNYVIYNET